MTLLSDKQLAEIRARQERRREGTLTPYGHDVDLLLDSHVDLGAEVDVLRLLVTDLLHPAGDGTEAAVRLYRAGRASLRGLLEDALKHLKLISPVSGYATTALCKQLTAALADIDAPGGVPSPDHLRGVEEERARVVRLLSERAALLHAEADAFSRDSELGYVFREQADALDDAAMRVERGEGG